MQFSASLYGRPSVLGSHPGLAGLGAVFSLEIDGEERVVAVQEIARGGPAPDAYAVAEAVIADVAAHHGVRLHDSSSSGPAASPRTTSGKVGRRHGRTLCVEGRFSRVGDGGHRSLGRNQ